MSIHFGVTPEETADACSDNPVQVIAPLIVLSSGRVCAVGQISNRLVGQVVKASALSVAHLGSGFRLGIFTGRVIPTT